MSQLREQLQESNARVQALDVEVQRLNKEVTTSASVVQVRGSLCQLRLSPRCCVHVCDGVRAPQASQSAFEILQDRHNVATAQLAEATYQLKLGQQPCARCAVRCFAAARSCFEVSVFSHSRICCCVVAFPQDRVNRIQQLGADVDEKTAELEVCAAVALG